MIKLFLRSIKCEKKGLWVFRLLGLLFSIIITVCNSFVRRGYIDRLYSSTNNIIFTLLKIIGLYIIFNIGIRLIFNFVSKNKIFIKKQANKFCELIFEKKSFLLPLIIIIIFWLPNIIILYPGILSFDPTEQVREYLGLETRFTEEIQKINPNSTINNHHPAFSTFLIGSCAKLGKMLGSTNFGFFIYTALQVLVLSLILAYTIHYMKKLKTPYWLRIIILIMYCIVPTYSLFSVNIIKDVIYAALTILYVIKLFEIVKNKDRELTLRNIILLIILMFLIIITRNNGIYLILLSFPFTMFVSRKNLLKLFIITVIIVLINVCYLNILLPALNVVPGSIREALSLPFQQTARYVKYYGNELSDEDKKAIDVVLGYGNLAMRYDPCTSDNVKDFYNDDATKEDLKNYFKVWLKCFEKHPICYIEATIGQTYGWFYTNPDVLYFYTNLDYMKKAYREIGYYQNDMTMARKTLDHYGTAFKDVPVIGMLVTPAFYTWVLLILSAFIIKKKKCRYVIIFTPFIASLLICMAGPINGLTRYALPYIYQAPIILAIVIYIMREEQCENN